MVYRYMYKYLPWAKPLRMGEEVLCCNTDSVCDGENSIFTPGSRETLCSHHHRSRGLKHNDRKSGETHSHPLPSVQRPRTVSTLHVMPGHVCTPYSNSSVCHMRRNPLSCYFWPAGMRRECYDRLGHAGAQIGKVCLRRRGPGQRRMR